MAKKNAKAAAAKHNGRPVASAAPPQPAAAAPEMSPEERASARAECIRRHKQNFDTLAAERRGFQEQAKGKGKQISNLFRLMKNDLGMDREDAEKAFLLVDLEVDNRDRTINTIREIFQACGVNQQTDFLGVLDQDGAAGGEKAATSEGSGYTYETGRVAGLEGKPMEDNPHVTNSAAWKIWNEGWQKGQAEAVTANIAASNGAAQAEATAH